MKEYSPPSSKSICHRAMLCATYCKNESIIENANICDDTLATANALIDLGAKLVIDKSNKTIRISQANFPSKTAQAIYCKDSASSLRMLIPQSLNLNQTVEFTGSKQLAKRPLDAYFDFFKANKISYQVLAKNNDDFLPLKIKGQLAAGNYQISASKSSQFASGLMLFLGSKNQSSQIELTGKIESLDYIKLTAQVMSYFGVNTSLNKNIISIAANGYTSKRIVAEADYSQASYFIALGLLDKGIIINNLNKNSLQADKRIIDFISKMQANFDFTSDKLIIKPSQLMACNLDVTECPDLAPTLAGLLSVAEGRSIISGCQRLIYKESDRLNKTVEELQKLGANIRVANDQMIIDGVKQLQGTRVSSHNDHRLAMMLAVLSPVTQGEIIIDNKECVQKSYPNFFKDVEEYYE